MSRQEVPHYCKGEIEFIDAMKSMLTPDEFRGAMKFNIAKYIWREAQGRTPSRHKKGDDLHGMARRGHH